MVNSDAMLSPAPTTHPQSTSLGHLVAPGTSEAKSPLQPVLWSNSQCPTVKGIALSQAAHLPPFHAPVPQPEDKDDRDGSHLVGLLGGFNEMI